ncbi:MAG: hypothetical protein IIY89_02355, partial [Clostridia bacterium]|nr:hypothetical protein [Clostridia bacterium]
MSDRYDNIKYLSRPQYDDLPPMSMHDRAAQFSPFAALVGYDDAVAETARLTDSRIELGEDMIDELNQSISQLLLTLDEQRQINVIYFVPDEKKAGGRYIEKTGVVLRFYSLNNALFFSDGEKIAVNELYK